MSRQGDPSRLAELRSRLRRENEELRRQAAVEHRRYDDLFETAPDAYVVSDALGKIVQVNRAAEKLFGVPRGFLVGKPLSVYLRPNFHAALLETRRSGVLEEREFALHSRARGKIEVGVTISSLEPEGEQGRLVRVIVRDISGRKRAEEEVRRLNAELEGRVRARTKELERANTAKDQLLHELSERSRVEREFVSNAAHELRTPVAAMASAVEVLESGAKERPEERDRFLGHIAEQCRRLQRLSESLLVLARAQMSQEPVRTEPVEVGPVLAAVAADIRPPSGVAVRVVCQDEVVALANGDLLEQALLNVAGNAARHVDRGSIELRADVDGDRVRIRVADTGPGMREEDRVRAFNRFHRGEGGDGFGLGLSIAAQALDVLGGEIELASEPGNGTTVLMLLPRP